MPIYEYACDRCGAGLLQFIRSSEDAAPRCERCGSRRLRRLMSRVNVVGSTRADDGVLRFRPRDFLERPERFGKAMQAFSARTGMKLDAEQVDTAMHRLSEAKKRST